MKRAITIERVLLGAIVVLQLTHLGVDLWHRGERLDPASERMVAGGTSGGAKDMGERRVVLGGGQMVATGPVIHPVDAVNVMMVQAVRDLERMSSMVIREERWRRLGSEPTMDMRERGDDYLVAVGLPRYVDPELLSVDLEGRLLTIRAQHAPTHPFMSPATVFERHVQLPGPVGSEAEVSAVVSNGVLRVCLPKATAAQPVVPGTRRRLF